jgi:hypothetical protein
VTDEAPGGTGTDGPEHPLAGVARDATSILAVVHAFEREGYTAQFSVRDGGRVECLACRSLVDPGAAGVDHFRRMEGASDPDDMLALAALTCPHCGAHGTLVLAFGPMAPEADMDVLLRLEDPPPPEPDAR